MYLDTNTIPNPEICNKMTRKYDGAYAFMTTFLL